MESKRLVRASVLAARAARSAADRAEAGRSLMQHGADLATGARVVVAHAAVGSEPPTRALLEALLQKGLRVLLPVVEADSRALGWGDLHSWDELQPSALGLLEPVADAAASVTARSAGLLLVPAVAVDRAGHRLGRGGGYYDRWLPEHPVGRVVAVVYDDEVLDEVPHEPHDRRVDAALTPSGVVSLG